MPEPSEGTPLEQGGEDPSPTTTDPAPDPEPKNAEDTLPDEVKAVLKKEREAAKAATKAQRDAAAQLKEMQARLQEFENRDLTEQERTAKRLQQLEAELNETRTAAQQRELEATRFRVAAQMGVPSDLVGRLQGTTEEELTADAAQLLSLIKTTTRAPDFDAGARTPPPAQPDMNSILRRGFGRGAQ